MAIYSATPRNQSLGTKDASTRVPPPPRPNRAQFKPKFYVWAEKGPLTPEEVNGGTALAMYGQDTFDQRSPYFNHATLFANSIFKAPANCIIERVFDPLQKVKANSTVWIDIGLEDIPEYERLSSGKYKLDGSGQPIQKATTIEGYKFKIYTSNVDNDTYDITKEGMDIYTAEPREGFMTDKNGDPSFMYPIATFVASNFGEAYNNEGISITPLIGDDADDALMAEEKVFGYSFSMHSIISGVKDNIENIFGDTNVKFAFKEEILDPTTRQPLQLEEVLPKLWQNLDNPENPVKYCDIGEPFIYYDNIETVTSLMFTREVPFVNTNVVTWDDGLDASTSEWFDFESDVNGALPDQNLLINLLTGGSSKKVNYFAIVKAPDVVNLTNMSETNISKATTIYLAGGSNGREMTNELFEELVVLKYDEYLDRDAMVISLPLNPESVFIDSGFTVDTKLRMANVQAHRRDIATIFSTYEWNKENKVRTTGEQRAIANLIKNKVRMFPESEYFGTEFARGIIIMGSGVLSDDSYRFRVPHSLDFVIKAAKYMGAGNGKWKEGFNFSRSPLNVIDTIKDVEPKFIPESTKSILWKAGLIWSQNKDKHTWFYPSSQTIYGNDTSVLNSFTSIVGICTIVKAHEDCWEEMSGATDLSNAEFIEQVEAYMLEELRDRFDGVIETDAKCVITKADDLRGYSWKLIT